MQPAALKSVGSIAVLHRPNSRLRAVVDPDLPQDRLHVDHDRGLGDIARARDHFVGMPFYKAVEHLGLALRQTVVISQRGHDIFMFGTVRLKLDLWLI